MSKTGGKGVQRTHSRRSLYARRVYDRILEQIIRGSLYSGERVVERTLAKSLDVSRTPVREAVLRLQQEGFLVPAAEDGEKVQLVVAPLRAEAALQLSQLVGALEGLAGRTAASAPPKERSTLAAQLTKDLNDFRQQLARRATFLRLFQIDERFHARFTDEYADDHLHAMLTVVRPHLARYTWAYGTSQEIPWSLYRDEHAQIIAAIRDGDPEKAEESVRADWNSIGRRFYSAASRR